MYPPRPKVTVTHEPSGISASANCDRTDRGNYDKAMGLLRSKLWAAQQKVIPESEIKIETFSVGSLGTEVQ